MDLIHESGEFMMEGNNLIRAALIALATSLSTY